jgi:hypothetical protein
MTEMTLALRPNVINSMEDVERAAQAMAKSGYFTDARDAAQAVVKILAGQEMGFGPFASMTGIYIIQGRPSIGANLMAAAVKSSQRYNYRVVEMTDQVCEIEYLEYGKPCGRSRFTLENASKAGTKNLDKFPRNMLFARAMSNGCRWYCPDIFAGAPTYTPEEMGANVNEAGEVIDVPAKVFTEPVTVPAPAPTSTQAQATATQVTPVTKDALKDAWPPSAPVSYDMAATVTSQPSGKRYLDMTVKELNGRLIHFQDVLAKASVNPDSLPQAERDAAQLKIDVAKMILAIINPQ